MRIKRLTTDCKSCKYFKINDNSDFICSWGHGKLKKMIIDNKRKSLISCKLSK